MKTTILQLFFLTLILCSCEKTKFDTETVNAINAVADGGDNLATSASALSAFMLPNSDDFANIPQDPKNPLTADKVALGKLLFHETKLGTNFLSTKGMQTY